MIDIKANVRYILRAKGLTQRDLAARMGVTPQAVTSHMRGKITLDTLERMAEALGVVASDIIAEPALSDRRPFHTRSESTSTTITCPACGRVLHLTAKE